MLAAQRDQRGREQGPHGCRERGDPQRASQSGAQRGERGVRLLQGGQHPVAVLGEQAARGRQRDPAAAALKQRRACLPFQHGQLLGHRRRRVRVQAGDRSDGAEAGQVAQQLEAAHVEHGRNISSAGFQVKKCELDLMNGPRRC